MVTLSYRFTILYIRTVYPTIVVYVQTAGQIVNPTCSLVEMDYLHYIQASFPLFVQKSSSISGLIIPEGHKTHISI